MASICLWYFENYCKNPKMSCLMTKPAKWDVCPAKTQISLGIRPVWSESTLSAWRKLGSLATHWVHSKDSGQTGQVLGAVILLVLSWGGSNWGHLKNCCNFSKIQTNRFYHKLMRPKDTDGMANSINPIRNSLIWVYTVCPDLFVRILFLASPMAEWLPLLIISALNRSSFHRCGIEPSSGHMWDKPKSACRWSGGFSWGSPVFAPLTDWLSSKWVK